MKARRLIALAAASLVLAVPAAAGAKTPFDGVHAHRGGPNAGGQAAYPENSLRAFRAAARLRVDVVELDVKLTADGVPVVMHDATLDRTTNCSRQVRQVTAAALRAGCRIDTVGTDALLRPAGGSGVRVPTLAETLSWAARKRVKLNVEIKNYPTDPDYDPTGAFARTVVAAIEASRIRTSAVLVQSFLPLNLDPARARGLPTALLLLQQGSNQVGIEAARRYDAVQPGWPTAGDPSDFVESAHAAGLPVIPYTIDAKAEIRRAFRLGVDGLITNDPVLGMRVRYRPLCRAAKRRERRARARYRERRSRSARRTYARAKRARKATCAKTGQ